MNKALVVIPARYGSTRLPAKVLLKKTGKYLIQHTYERVQHCHNVSRIIIATDDKRVERAGRSFGAEVWMTAPEHTCGTERVAEVVKKLSALESIYVINVQGDEPEIDPGAVDRLVETLQPPEIDMATLACPIKYKKDLADPNKVKVMVDRCHMALSFQRVVTIDKRQAIPPNCYRHLGVYGYKRAGLLKFIELPRTQSEITQRLEQLRALENGFCIKVVLVHKSHYGIDTKGDYDKFAKRMGV